MLSLGMVPEEIRRRRIDPMVDYVFKILLGTEENKDVLIFFLNSVLGRKGTARLLEVTLLNPYNDKEFGKDKLTIVDVKARDGQGHWYQIEVQLVVHPYLPERMVYSWCQLYGKQLVEGEEYQSLKPVTAIWLVRGTVFEETAAYVHRAQLQDKGTGVILDKESGIYVLEVEKWRKGGDVKDTLDEWLKFMSEARMMDLETLSERLSPEFARAVEALRPIREREADYWYYQSRLEYLRVQATMEAALEETREALLQRDQVLEETRGALADRERVLAKERRERAAAVEALAEKEQALEVERREKAAAAEALEAERREKVAATEALEVERREKAAAAEALAEKELVLEAERREKAAATEALEAKRQKLEKLQAWMEELGLKLDE
ncbi:MAG: Rpn family recombination-promoting nuclease/putative transposase [Myxococcota bacterium]